MNILPGLDSDNVLTLQEAENAESEIRKKCETKLCVKIVQYLFNYVSFLFKDNPLVCVDGPHLFKDVKDVPLTECSKISHFCLKMSRFCLWLSQEFVQGGF